MKKTLIPVLLILCLLASLLTGCLGAAPDETPDKPDHTKSSQASDDTEAQDTETSETDAPETNAPDPDTAETDAPSTEDPEPTDEPTPPEDLYFVMVPDESCNRYTDGFTEIVFYKDTRDVICRDVETGAEQTLFTVEPDDTIFISLIGVTENRLYFGWNELEDWWGVNVYSVDYHGSNRAEYGSAWDPSFEDGWLLLLGFRSDVSPTELLLIDRDDQIVAADESGAVWDATVIDRDVYYLCVEDMPESWPYEDPAEGWTIDLILVDRYSNATLMKTFAGQPSAYSPAFIRDDVICFYETNEYYDLFTLEPTGNPFD